MMIYRLGVLAALCLILTAGCENGRPFGPRLDLTEGPDKDVKPPSWYAPAKEYSPWPLEPAPKHGTEAWRHWCAVRYNSRDLVRQAETPPKIDGKLDDEVWQDSGFKAPFVVAVGKPASPRTTVYMAYDDTHLYIALRIGELYPNKLRATTVERDGLFRREDHVDIGLVPGWTDKALRVYWFLVNPKGAVQDGVNSNAAWSPKLEVAAKVEEKSWNVELAVPLEAFGAKGDDLWGRVWACRFVRRRFAGGSRETSSWTRLVDDEEGTCSWGHVIFKGVKPPPKKKPEPPPKTGPADKDKEPPAPPKGGTE